MPDFDLVCMGWTVGKGRGRGEGCWGGGGTGEEIDEGVGEGDCGVVEEAARLGEEEEGSGLEIEGVGEGAALGGKERRLVEELVTCWTTVKGCIWEEV